MKNNIKILAKAKNLHRLGNLDDAIKYYKKLLRDIKDNSQIYFLIGTAYLQKKNYGNAYNYLLEAISLNKTIPNYFNNVGITLSELNKDEEAINNYKQALKLKPNYLDALINYAISLKNLKKFEDAIILLNRSLNISPENHLIYNNLGNIFREIGNITKAIECYEKAISLKNDYVEALNNKAEILLLKKNFTEAIKVFKKVLQIDHKFNFSFGKMLHCKMNICDWKKFDENIKIIKDAVKNDKNIIEPFPMLSLIDDPILQKKNAIIYNKVKHQRNLLKENKYSQVKEKKIKIGYFGAEFYSHPVLHLTKDIFENHDKSKFEIYAFFHGPIKDKLHIEVQKFFKRFININELSDREVIQLSRTIGINIAVNLTGYTADSRNEIFFERVAPIQISFLGYSSTMGSKSIDHIVADKFLIPTNNYKSYSENVLNMPNCFLPSAYYMQISKKKFSKNNLNLSDDKFIFGCFNNSYKITPKIFISWMNILSKVQNSVLWLLYSNDEARKNLNYEAQKYGVDPKRIIYADKVSQSEHLKRYQLMDLFLDTFPYNAHATASEAIRSGVPIITLSGRSFASRVAGSLLSAIKMQELICENLNDYVNKAVKLASNIKEFKKIKKKFEKENTRIIFDSKRYTKDLEKIYINLVNKQS